MINIKTKKDEFENGVVFNNAISKAFKYVFAQLLTLNIQQGVERAVLDQFSERQEMPSLQLRAA